MERWEGKKGEVTTIRTHRALHLGKRRGEGFRDAGGETAVAGEGPQGKKRRGKSESSKNRAWSKKKQKKKCFKKIG